MRHGQCEHGFTRATERHAEVTYCTVSAVYEQLDAEPVCVWRSAGRSADANFVAVLCANAELCARAWVFLTLWFCLWNAPVGSTPAAAPDISSMSVR